VDWDGSRDRGPPGDMPGRTQTTTQTTWWTTSPTRLPQTRLGSRFRSHAHRQRSANRRREGVHGARPPSRDAGEVCYQKRAPRRWDGPNGRLQHQFPNGRDTRGIERRRRAKNVKK
jgi:hypothetical protein